jgi:myo-inositol-1-phosphate synthase
MDVRVALSGVGNCASALVQGIEYYKNAGEAAHVPGLMHVDFGGYHVRDVRFVAAFEINRNKIGLDLSEAIWAEPNVCVEFAEVPKLGVEVMAGPALDGVAPHMQRPFFAYD